MITSVLQEKIVKFIEYKEKFSSEQKDANKNELYGHKDQLLIGKMIVKNCRSHEKIFSQSAGSIKYTDCFFA